MTRREKWLVRAAMVGAAATLLAIGVFWFVLTRPVALATVLDRAF